MYRALVPSIFLLFVACGDTTVTVQPKGFTRSDDVAYLCVNRQSGEAADRATCQDHDNYALLALVTQRDRGEIASVDLRAETLIDTNRVIPGHTFAAVGDLPSGIAVAEQSPKRIYVSNAGSFDVVALEPTRVVRTDNDTAVPNERVSFEVAPASLSIAPNGSRLFVSLPDTGQIGVVELEEDGSFGAVSTLTLTPPSIEIMELQPEAQTWCFSCPSERCAQFGGASGGLSWVPRTTGSSPRPGRSIVDPDAGTVLVTDSSLPFIYRVDMSSLSIETIPTAAPLRALALTDALPITLGAEETKRYLYAVSAESEDLLVMNYPQVETLLVGQEDRGNPVHIDLNAPIIDIAYFSQTAEEACTPGEGDAGPLRLNGSFIGAVTGNGRLHVIDLYDADVTAGCRDDCSADGEGVEVASYVRRHRPRIASRIRRGISLSTVPTFSIGPLNIRPEDNGVSAGGIAPDLGELSCPDDMTQVFPDPTDPEAAGPARLCALANPWGGQDARWRAFYEGTIPNSLGGDPRISGDGARYTLEASQDFCSVGVLGFEQAQAAGAGAPELAYGGDDLYIREELRLPQRDDPSCEQLFGEDASEVYRRFPIVSASAHALTLGAGAIDFDEVVRCLGERPAFEVRTNDAFVVGSTSRVPQHRIREALDGSCAVDTTLPMRLQFRAMVGQPFDNGEVAFNLQPASEDGESGLVPDTEVVLSFTVDDVPLPMQFTDLATLPTRVSFVPERSRLYVIDSLSRNYRYLRLDTLSKGDAFP